MSRPKGARTFLIKITYSHIGEWVGIGPDAAKRLARQGLFDARDLASVLRWVNGLRQQQGLSLIGVPDDVGEAEGHSDDDDPGPVSSTPTPPEMAGIFRYNPRRACFEEDDA